MVFTVYSFIYLLTSLASFLVGFLAIQRKAVVGAWELFFLSIAVAVSTYFCFFESMAVTQQVKVFWAAASYLGATSIPVFYLLFVLRLTRLIRFKSIRFGWVLFVFPVITSVLALTNAKHHLIWNAFSAIDPTTNVMMFGHGVWFWVGYTVYSYLLLCVTTFFVFNFIYRNRKKRPYWRQGFLLLLGGLIPWLTSCIYIFGISPFKGLDIVPISTLIGAIFFTDAILSGSFLNLIPVARETLVESLPLGILALDKQNRIQDINVLAREFLSISQKDVLGMTLNNAMSNQDALLMNIQSRKSPLELEVTSLNASRYFTITKIEIPSIPGSRLITIQDSTEQIQRQQELVVAKKQAEESDRLKSAFLANMSHEIRTPMNGIVGFVSLLQREDVTPQERNEFLEIIKNNSFRLLTTLNDIIDLSKIESGQMPLLKTSLDVYDLVLAMKELFLKDAEAKHLVFEVLAPEINGPLNVISDKGKLYSIVIRLIKNAIKYTNEGFVRFECSLRDNMLELRVTDSGIGIEESKQKMVFERFVQASDYSNRLFEGSGLGLSITKAYVEMLNGSLELTSMIGKGSSFLVRIPVQL